MSKLSIFMSAVAVIYFLAAVAYFCFVFFGNWGN